MNYAKFRSRCNKSQQTLSYNLSLFREIPKDKPANPAIIVVMQQVLDRTFESIVEYNANRLTNTPLWLLDIYNDFVRLIESDEIVFEEKISTTLQLMKLLFAEVSNEMGDQWVKKLFEKSEQDNMRNDTQKIIKSPKHNKRYIFYRQNKNTN